MGIGRLIAKVFTYVCSFWYQPGALVQPIHRKLLSPAVARCWEEPHTPLHSSVLPLRDRTAPGTVSVCSGAGGSYRFHVRCQVLPDFIGVLMIQINCSE